MLPFRVFLDSFTVTEQLKLHDNSIRHKTEMQLVTKDLDRPHSQTALPEELRIRVYIVS